MNLPRDIFGIVTLFLDPLSKLALSHTCRKYRRMFGTLRSIINDHCYDIGFISRFMHAETCTTSFIFKFCSTTKDSRTETYEPWTGCRRCFHNNKWHYGLEGSHLVPKTNLRQDGYPAVDFVNPPPALVEFSDHMFATFDTEIVIFSKNGDIRNIKCSARYDYYHLSETMLIIGDIMFHKNGRMYKNMEYCNIIAVCDYIMWRQSGFFVNSRYIP